jgi:WD40 repeat protein
VTVFDAATLESRFSLVHNETVASMDWSLDSSRLVTGAHTTAKVWAVGEDGPRELMTLAPRFPGGIGTAAFSPDGSQVITGDAETPTVKLWDVSISGDAEVANIPGTMDFYTDVAFMPDGARVAVTLGRDFAIRIWDLGERRTVREIGPPRPRVGYAYEQEMFEVSPDGAAIATVTGSGAASIWDVATGEEIFTVPKSNLITSANWSQDGSQIAMSSLHGWARVFDRSGREIGVLREPTGSVAWWAEFTPDGRFVVLVTGPKPWRRDPEGRTTIWDVERGEVVRTIEGAGSTWSAISPTGDRHVTTHPSGTGAADVWNLETGERVARLVDEGMVNVAVGPDGDRIAGGMEDATVRLFDAASGDQGLVLRGHEDPVAFVDFSPDGSMLVSAAADGVVRVWALDIDLLLEIARAEVTRSLTDKECRQYLHVEACPA